METSNCPEWGYLNGEIIPMLFFGENLSKKPRYLWNNNFDQVAAGESHLLQSFKIKNFAMPKENLPYSTATTFTYAEFIQNILTLRAVDSVKIFCDTMVIFPIRGLDNLPLETLLEIQSLMVKYWGLNAFNPDEYDSMLDVLDGWPNQIGNKE